MHIATDCDEYHPALHSLQWVAPIPLTRFPFVEEAAEAVYDPATQSVHATVDDGLKEPAAHALQ
jgi:hypothetical protein